VTKGAIVTAVQQAGAKEIERLKGALAGELEAKRQAFAQELERERAEAARALERFKSELTLDAEVRRQTASKRVHTVLESIEASARCEAQPGVDDLVAAESIGKQAVARPGMLLRHELTGNERVGIRVHELPDDLDAVCRAARATFERVPSGPRGKD
jgi:hypothetical protein